MTRAERASVTLAARIVATRGQHVSLTLRDNDHVAGVLTDASPQWLLITAGTRQHLVPAAAVTSFTGLSTKVAQLSQVERRLTIGHALRALSRDRARVIVHTDAAALAGVIGVVGEDHLDLSTAIGADGRVTIPFAALIQVRSADA